MAVPIPPTATTPPSYGLSGWNNIPHSLTVDFSAAPGTMLSGMDKASFSTAAALLTFVGVNIKFQKPDGTAIQDVADTRIEAIVQEDGSQAGNLVAGIVTMHAGPHGIPKEGVTAGELLMAGYAIGSAATPQLYSVSLLFALSYKHKVLFANLGDYVTFFGPYPGCWGAPTAQRPWGRNWSLTGATSFGFNRTA